MSRTRLLWPLLALGFATPAFAESLADVRVELGQLAAEFNALKSELTTTGASARLGGSDALARMDTLEAELMRLTSRTEAIELRLSRVVSDGTNRIGDIEFRLCEAEPGCDPMNMPPTAPLGGDSGAKAAPSGASSASSGSTGSGSAGSSGSSGNAGSSAAGPEMAVAEREDFDRAREVLGQGDFPRAASLFETYAQSYPGGPLVPEAHSLRGDALMQSGNVTGAARAWLAAYTSAPQGPLAPDAVLKLGNALGQLGQTEQACVTLAQIMVEFPTSPAAGQAPSAMQRLGCR